MILSDTEIKVIYDQEFLLIKNKLIKKVQLLFSELQQELFEEINNSAFIFPQNVDVKIGKIFKGEDYRNLPYVVLDFPKLFSKENVFTVRTMFWWSNFFSTTLHIQGNILEIYRDKIYNNLKNHINTQLYICVNKSPWEYHYDKTNYQLLTNDNIQIIKDLPFIKLSKKYELNEYEMLMEYSKSFLQIMLNVLN